MRTDRRRPRGSSEVDRRSWATTYERTPYQELPWFDPEPSPEVVRAVEEGFLPARSPVLDVGCGAGSNLLYLARKGLEAHGIDLSPGAVAAARKRAEELRLPIDAQVGDALALEFPEGRFAGMVDIGCFHTLPIRRRPEYAREAARALRPGGSFVLSWVARESTQVHGPPHRPSLGEVVATFEGLFLFVRTGFSAAAEEGHLSTYVAWLRRRAVPQPPPR